jgi:hypothetical protein
MVNHICYKCNKVFKQKGHLNTHLNKKFPCDIKSYKTKKTDMCAVFDTNVQKKARMEIQCYYCNRIYKRNSELNRHIKTCKKKKEEEFKKDTYNVLLKKIEDHNKIIEDQKIIIEDLQQRTSGNVKEKDIKDIVRILKNSIKNNRTEIIELKYRL